jgi:hypothetical protein
MSEMDEIEKELDREQEIYPNWEPAEGEKLIGEVIRKDNAAGYDLIVVKPVDGEPLTVWKSTTLNELFEKVKVGDIVGLKYLGQATSEKGRTYKNIRFVLKPAAKQPQIEKVG